MSSHNLRVKNIDLFFEENPNPMWIYDPDNYCVVDVNDAALQLYGYTREEALSLTIKDLRSKQEIDRLIKEVEKKKNGLNDAGIWKHKKKNGDQISVRVISTPIHVEDDLFKLVLIQDVTDQINAESDFKREKQFLDSLTENVPGSFFVFNQEGKMIRWNQKMEEITGYASGEISKMSPEEYFEGENREKAIEAIQHAFENGSVETELNVSTKNGDVVPFFISASRFEINDEPHLIGIGIDISEKEEALLSAQSQRQLLEAVMEQSESVIFVKEVGGRYRLVNEKFCELFNLNSDEVYRLSDYDLFDKEVADQIRKNDQKVLDSGRGRTLEERIPLENEIQHYVTNKYPLKDIEGFENCICGVANNVTDIKNAEIELELLYQKEKEQRLQYEDLNYKLNLLAKINSIFLENKGNLDSALEKVSELLIEKVSDSCSIDVLVQNDLKRITTCHRDEAKEKIAKKIHREHPEVLYGSEFIRKVLSDKDQIFIEKVDQSFLDNHISDPELYKLAEKMEMESILFKPLLANDHEVGVMSFLLSGNQKDLVTDSAFFLDEIAHKIALSIERHLTNLKLLEFNKTLNKRVKERTHQLEEANKELESFSYSVSHDLRAPLRAIDGYTSILLEDYMDKLDSQGKEFLQIVNDESKRMGELIDDLLAFSRMNRRDKDVEVFEMEPLVRQCISDVRQANPDVEPVFTVNSLPKVNADESLLKQVWINLLGNSVKYRKSGQKPEITVDCTFDNQKKQFVFSVKDNGVGFDMKYADKLFGVFQRLHNDAEFEGTGIGLALVRRIINRHGGETWADSELEKGTTVYFTLPASHLEENKV